MGEHALRLLALYGLTIAIETPILMVALSRGHPWRHRLFAGIWLTACTYPVVVLLLPSLISPVTSRPAYLLAAEIFAPIAECLLFRLAFDRGRKLPRAIVWRDFAAIVVANLASFITGEIVQTWG